MLHFAALLCLTSPKVPARQDRITFYTAMLKVQEGWSKSQVEALLGPPDDLWGNRDATKYARIGEEVWCYGSNGHVSMPTLGRVTFVKNKVIQKTAWEGEKPPPLSVITDAQLSQGLRAITHFRRTSFSEYDPLAVIRCANALRPLGKAKSLAVLIEYDRLRGIPDARVPNFAIVKYIFQPKNPPGFFAIPRLGLTYPTPPDDLRIWPAYPFVTTESIPFSAETGYILHGLAEPFRFYVARDSMNWVLAPRPSSPPDDPFPALEKALQAANDRAVQSHSTFLGFANDFKQKMTDQLGELIRNVWTKQDAPMLRKYYAQPDELHKAFLAAGGHWDPVQQVYVRRDGSFTPDRQSNNPPRIYAFRNTHAVKPVLVLERDSEDWVRVQITYQDSRSLKITGTIVEEKGGKVLLSFHSDRADPVQPLGENYIGDGLDLPPNTIVRCVLNINGKTYTSPLINP